MALALPATALLATAMLTIAALLFSPAVRPAQAGELGAFLALTNTYAYRLGPHEGNRVLVKSRLAYPVIGQAFDDADRLWFRIVLPEALDKVEGMGWTPLAASELATRGDRPVEIYSRPLDEAERAFRVEEIPASDVEMLKETQPSTMFPQVQWRKVRYVSRRAAQPWVRASTGIYRPGKSTSFLTQNYADLVARNLPRELMTRLLSGVVRTGDTPQQVRWALGEPLRSSEERARGVQVTVWEYPELKVRFDDAVVGRVY